MISRNVAVGLFAAACLAAAAGGAYVAVRQNASAPEVLPETVSSAPPVSVAETEAVVTPEAPPAASPPAPTPAASEPAVAAPPQPSRIVAARRARPAANRRPADVEPRREAVVPAAPDRPADLSPAPSVTPVERAMPDPLDPPVEPARAPEPIYDEIVIPASAVVGLEIDRTITSEQAEVEDRVDARVTRDVYADGRVAIPSGSRAIGTVTLVERGGKMKDRARLGIRFHSIVLADGRQLPIRTDPIYREGDSPGAESSRKIGGAAIGGAVLGAILGGGKGAMTGAAVGAAGGTAAVMAGGRNPATVTGGSIVNVRLSSPVTLEIER